MGRRKGDHQPAGVCSQETGTGISREAFVSRRTSPRLGAPARRSLGPCKGCVPGRSRSRRRLRLEGVCRPPDGSSPPIPRPPAVFGSGRRLCGLRRRWIRLLLAGPGVGSRPPRGARAARPYLRSARSSMGERRGASVPGRRRCRIGVSDAPRISHRRKGILTPLISVPSTVDSMRGTPSAVRT